MKYISDVSKEELHDKRVLVRAGLDLPLDALGEVSDLFRVKRASLTLRYVCDRGAKVIVISHIGRDPNATNAPVERALKVHLPVHYVPDIVGPAAKSAVASMRPGEILLLENLRRDPREVENDGGFAKDLANLGDMYVNDAFSAAHRAHASIVGIPKFLPSYGGILLHEEIDALSRARNPGHPSFAILGGAKFETKAPLIKKLLEMYDHLFIAGALANDVFKAQGFPIGISLISKELPGEDVLKHPHFIAPIDVTVESPDGQARVKKPQDVKDDERIVDIGPDSLALIAPFMTAAKSMLWNGPTGLYEKGYVSWTHAIAEIISKSSAQRVIGGGDTIAAIQESGIAMDSLGFLSTGGGAMLEYLLQGALPGIEALN